jgi:hypothetical protein
MARKPKKATTHETSVEREAFGQTIEVEIVVDYDFEPGEREIRYGDSACPGCDPLVTIDGVTVKTTGESLALTQDEIDAITDAIIEERTAPEDEGY